MIELIEINGEEHPVRVSYYAIKRTKLELQKKYPEKDDIISMTDIMSGDIELMEPMLFYGLEAAYKAEGKDVPFERADAELLLDGCFFEFLELLPKFFPQNVKKKGEQILGKYKIPAKKKT
jgi:hypothetical protein